MPNTTTNRALTLPITTDAPSELRLAITANASAVDGDSVLSSVVANTVSSTVSRGQSVIASPSTTQTLPSTTSGALVAIIADITVTGATPVTVAAAGGNGIYGVGVNGTSFKLGAPGAFALLQADNGSHWRIIAGQQDSGWLTIGLPTNWGTPTGYAALAARVVGDRVLLRGAAQNNTAGSSTFSSTIPAAASPTSTVQFVCSQNLSGTPACFATIASGVVTVTPAVSNTAILSFEGVQYSLT